MENIKVIKGAQNIPQSECIRVNKVYDWVILTEGKEEEVTVSADCLTFIQNAMQAGSSVVITCNAPNVPDSVFPLPPYPQPAPVPGEPTCQVIGIQRPVTLPNGAVGAVVSFIQTIPIVFTVTATATDGTITTCSFSTTISIKMQAVLCLPDGLDASNITCSTFNLTCNTTGVLYNTDKIDVSVVVCKDIQVEADVKLEVTASFCQPRGPIPVPPINTFCPSVVNFPASCPSFFPPTGCPCQGSVTNTDYSTVFSFNPPLVPTEPIVMGTSVISANICPNCSSDGSTLYFNFEPASLSGSGGLASIFDTVGYPTDPAYSFALTANFGDPVGIPTCTTSGTTTTLTVSGTGIVTYNNLTIPNVPFTFTLNSVLGGTGSYSLAINPLGNAPAIPIINMVFPVIAPVNTVTISTCT